MTDEPERPEAYKPFRQSFLRKPDSFNGSPIRTYGDKIGLISIGCGFIFLCFLAVVAFGSSSRVEVLTGSLAPADGAVDLTPARPGSVSAVHVSEGMLVAAGAPIVSISTDSTTRGGALADSLSSAADVQAAAAEQDHQAVLALLDRDAEDIRNRRGALQDQLKSSEAQHVLLSKQLMSAEDIATRIQPLAARGVISMIQMRQYEATAAQIGYQVASLEGQQAGYRRELEKTYVDERRLQAQRSQAIARANIAAAQLNEKRATIENQRSQILTATRPGKVVSIRVRAGDPVSSATPVATILPTDGKLIAEVGLPSKAMGFVRKGDRVQLTYDAFPEQVYGVAKGRVTYVSATPIRDAPAAAPDPTGTGSVQYLARIALDRQAVTKDGRVWPLAPGMNVKAKLTLERHSIIDNIKRLIFRH